MAEFYGRTVPVSASRASGAGDFGLDTGSARASYVQKNVTKVQYESGEGGEHNGHHAAATGGWGAYGGAWWGRYMGWYWLIWVFLVPIIIFILLLAFPPSCLLYTNPANGQPTLDLTRTLAVSVFVGWFIVLIFWLACAFWGC